MAENLNMWVPDENQTVWTSWFLEAVLLLLYLKGTLYSFGKDIQIDIQNIDVNTFYKVIIQT